MSQQHGYERQVSCDENHDFDQPNDVTCEHCKASARLYYVPPSLIVQDAVSHTPLGFGALVSLAQAGNLGMIHQTKRALKDVKSSWSNETEIYSYKLTG